MQQKLIEMCNREGISIDNVILFFSGFRSKIFLQIKHVVYQSLHMLLAGLKVQFFNQKKLSLCLLKKTLLSRDKYQFCFFTEIWLNVLSFLQLKKHPDVVKQPSRRLNKE